MPTKKKIIEIAVSIIYIFGKLDKFIHLEGNLFQKVLNKIIQLPENKLQSSQKKSLFVAQKYGRYDHGKFFHLYLKALFLKCSEESNEIKKSSDEVLKGIEKARELGLEIKINTVLIKNFNIDEILSLVKWCARKSMNLSKNQRFS